MEIKKIIENLINNSLELEMSIRNKNGNILENSNLFLVNGLIRTNHILKSVNSLIDNFNENKYAIYILLRPLMLDYLLYFYLFQEIEKENNEVLKKEKLEKLCFDCLLDGIDKLYLDIKRRYVNIELNEALNGFLNRYHWFIDDKEDLLNLSFKKPELILKNITASNLYSMINNKSKTIESLYFNYNLLSKYEHFTFVSLDHLTSKDGNHESIINEVVYLVDDFYRYLELLIYNENKSKEIEL
ncbi:MAE-28990/MAE-18760-like HEPN domain-containing protein [Flavobacterium branchiophilum]|uniref:Uncharacterized protein n=1 Tax=Flavobacterium branchiophilum (strain FL-15) TaxID=1034807 RepID=G2Z149_FLABF|nr:hypothetical protein [Flavobacterium branchiophilum]CCB69612.1 Hypothetical protein FBFL15_1547 [Flavobacterium branchiophilum FL-15]